MNRRYFFALLVALGLITAAAFVAHMDGGQFAVLNPAGPIGLAERHVIFLTLLLSATIVLPVFFLLFYFAWKYRADSPESHIHHRPNWDHLSRFTEFAWWLVPSVIVAIMAVIMWQSAHALDPYKPIPTTGQTVTVQVVALDWKWLFIYPQFGIASVNRLEMPVATPVHFILTADAPMNSFWIPSLGGQIMVMPGMTTQLNLAADRVGDFPGFSANISGKGFAGMAFTAHAVSSTDFHTWVRHIQTQTPAAELTIKTYDALAAPSENTPVRFYTLAVPSLFTDILHTDMTKGGIMPLSTSSPAS